ncbi:MAG TPA: hypothetical protein PK325_08505 [Cyclobacteriaceae bacterium]|nr:hypothetical protein [Cyclobacteriaceae bacterium]HMV09132.1 hypothetical protein [Cyclobacteriaceae bacterium]HMX01499.1 hypothetical protein [Cyclobacteriaceae bacterium]HMX50231.1 hypothetical protein [Cyclobacteriaceae bacterium]HMY92299.1 hypothetical protein [Cyclobacteriaceae bacterium]
MKIIRNSCSVVLGLVVLICFGCKPNKKTFEDQISTFSTESDSALYSYLKKKMSKQHLDSLCALQGKVVYDITLMIEENSVKDVYLNVGYVLSENGDLLSGEKEFKALEAILKESTLKQFPTYSKTEEGNFGLRIDFSNVCKN